jgi:DNA-binding MarR family transcriptional regulator/GNAT superfamily N-acetyltransferase
MDAGQIGGVRRFNRVVSQRIGALDDRFLGRRRPLGEARLLYEIGSALGGTSGTTGVELRALRAWLGLDSGYLSRLLRSLEDQGLVTAAPAAGDARVRRVTLTRAGRREVAELDRRSDAFAASLLAPLSGAQRSRLIAAMTEIERLLRASAVHIGAEPATSPAARRCLDQYFAELARRFDTGYDPQAALPVDPAEVTPPRGVFLVARLGGEPVGCCCLRVKSATLGEIKRMWVHEGARGLGVGRRLLDAIETQAREFGLATLRLDTHRSLTEAQALYRSRGYRDVAPFNGDPYADFWLAKDGI